MIIQCIDCKKYEALPLSQNPIENIKTILEAGWYIGDNNSGQYKYLCPDCVAILERQKEN